MTVFYFLTLSILLISSIHFISFVSTSPVTRAESRSAFFQEGCVKYLCEGSAERGRMFIRIVGAFALVASLYKVAGTVRGV